MDLRIFVCTWNVAVTAPLSDKDFSELLQLEEGKVDIYAIGFQEIKSGPLQNNAVSTDDWTERLLDLLSNHGYYLVRNVRVRGISLCVFSLLKHLGNILYVQTEIERTGVADVWGDKGGVAVSCQLYGQYVCFLDAHLEAHIENIDKRLGDLHEIYGEMKFRRRTTILDHDLVLMFGDLNFRIDDYDRGFVIKTIKEKNYSVLWEKDQLIENQKTDDILSQFTESKLNFDPTYKFDPNTDVYDTSEKQRKPAWTDRILWRVSPKISQKNSAFSFSLIDGSFTNVPSFKQSDHRPVIGQFDLEIRSVPQPFRLKIEPLGSWSCDKDGEFQAVADKDMPWSSRDYVGLYKEKLKGHLSYKTYIYVPKYEDSQSSSSSSSSDEDCDIEETLLEFCQRICLDDGKVVKKMKFKKSQIREPGMYRLGYYSKNLSCLLAVSDVFEIK